MGYESRYSGAPIHTPHILGALFTASDRVALNCFEHLDVNLGKRVAVAVQTKIDGLGMQHTTTSGHRSFDWMERDDVRKTLILAEQANSSTIQSKHLLLALLMSVSNTTKELRGQLGQDRFVQLVKIVRDWPEHFDNGPSTPV